MAPDDPKALAAAISDLLNDPARLLALGRGAELSVQKYSRAKIADRWENIFQDAIATAVKVK